METKLYTIQRFSILLSILCSLFSILSFSQTYEWQWAKSGGGNGIYGFETPGSIGNIFDVETIRDIVIDVDNNYYFLASLANNDTHVDGNSVTNYASPTQNTSSDILIFSFTCEGAFRWSRTIGGSSTDLAYHLTLDNNGGIYTNVYVSNLIYESDSNFSVHFSEVDIMPFFNENLQEEQEALKRGFL